MEFKVEKAVLDAGVKIVFVVIQGLDDYIVAENDNVLLICKKSEEQQIRQYVTDIQVDFGKEFV